MLREASCVSKSYSPIQTQLNSPSFQKDSYSNVDYLWRFPMESLFTSMMILMKFLNCFCLSPYWILISDSKDCFHFFILKTLHSIWHIPSTMFFVFLELRIYVHLLPFLTEENWLDNRRSNWLQIILYDMYHLKISKNLLFAWKKQVHLNGSQTF